jgi:hypothetical protein
MISLIIRVDGFLISSNIDLCQRPSQPLFDGIYHSEIAV